MKVPHLVFWVRYFFYRTFPIFQGNMASYHRAVVAGFLREKIGFEAARFSASPTHEHNFPYPKNPFNPRSRFLSGK